MVLKQERGGATHARCHEKAQGRVIQSGFTSGSWTHSIHDSISFKCELLSQIAGCYETNIINSSTFK